MISPAHKVWCLMMSTTAEILRHISDAHFIPSVLGFITTYWHQFEGCFGIASDAHITCGGLEEMEKATQLLYCLMLSSAREDSATDWTPAIAMQDMSVGLLEQVTYLLNHPGTLAKRMVAITRDEKEVFVTSSVAGQKAPVSLQVEIEARLFIILRNIIASICQQVDMEKMLLESAKGSSEGVLRDSIGLSVLMDSLSYVTDVMKRGEVFTSRYTPSERTDVISRRFSPANLTLVSTQILALIAMKGKTSGGDRRELTDSVQMVVAALESLRKTGMEADALVKQSIEEVREIERYFVKSHARDRDRF
ncbi:hypothetical protein HK101_009843 [Irineochytrium annulatum]|nr:hypothetical protein HK101_009843 [Irineochytrium annulatum]